MTTEEYRNDDLETIEGIDIFNDTNLKFLLHEFGIAICITTIVILCLYPLNAIKTRVQSQNAFWKTGLYRSLYRGLLLTLLSNFLVRWIRFSAEVLARKGRDYLELPPHHINVLAIFILEFIICLLLVPRDNVVQLQQISNQPLEAVSTFSKIYREDGIRNGIFRGYWITVLEQEVRCVFGVILHVLSETFNDPYQDDWDFKKYLIISLIIIVIISLCAVPLNLAKTLIQLDHFNKLIDESEYFVNRNPFLLLRDMWKQKGIIGIYSGLTPYLVYDSCEFIIYSLLTYWIYILVLDVNIVFLYH